LGTSGYLWVPLGASGYLWVPLLRSSCVLAVTCSAAHHASGRSREEHSLDRSVVGFRRPMLGPIPLRGSDRVGQVVSAHLPYSVQAPKRGEGQTQEGHWAAISHYATPLSTTLGARGTVPLALGTLRGTPGHGEHPRGALGLPEGRRGGPGQMVRGLSWYHSPTGPLGTPRDPNGTRGERQGA